MPGRSTANLSTNGDDDACEFTSCVSTIPSARPDWKPICPSASRCRSHRHAVVERPAVRTARAQRTVHMVLAVSYRAIQSGPESDGLCGAEVARGSARPGNINSSEGTGLSQAGGTGDRHHQLSWPRRCFSQGRPPTVAFGQPGGRHDLQPRRRLDTPVQLLARRQDMVERAGTACGKCTSGMMRMVGDVRLRCGPQSYVTRPGSRFLVLALCR
jgi:hypothetical protein